jgi:Na+-transporting methylmalonyl-CoA/oxaloacetate decarboxylase gamma subunit
MTKNTIVVLGCLAVMALLDILIYMSQNMSQI